jgi:hypothetical protein
MEVVHEMMLCYVRQIEDLGGIKKVKDSGQIIKLARELLEVSERVSPLG